MAAVLSDQDVAQRVLDHIRDGTTDLGESVWREPVEHYRSEDRLRAEVALMRRWPTPFCPSAALPQAGSHVAREAAGVPLIAVRGRDGAARVFRNACRHRGMVLAEGEGCARALTCRYHGWAYDLDGRLAHVPHEHGFPGLDKGAHGLVPVKAEERHGMVFVTQDEPALCDDRLDDLEPIIGPEQQHFASTRREVAANWKLVAEGLIEGYHIRSTHPESFLPYGFDNLNVIDLFAPNSRVTYPFRRIRKLEGVPAAERRIDGLLTYVYHLFPNVFITQLSRHTNLLALEPLGVGRTAMVSYALTCRGGTGPEAVEEASRDAAFVGDTGGAEDRAVVEAIQRGLESKANDAFTFGRFESAIVQVHKTLAVQLGGG